MRCVACRYFPLTRRNFRFPGNEARSAEVTASLIEPGSSGIVSAQRRRSSRIPRAPLRFLYPPSYRSYFIGTLEDVRLAITPFPESDDDSRDRTSKSSHDSDGLSIPLSPEIRSPLGTISSDDGFHFAL